MDHEDAVGPARAGWSGLRLDRETTATIALVVLAAGLAFLALGEERSTRTVAGGLLCLGGVVYLATSPRVDRWRSGNGLAAVGVLVGVSLLVIPARADFVLSTLAGLALVVIGLRETAASLRLGTSWGRVVTRGALLLPVGAALALLSGTLVTIGLVLAAAAVSAYAAVRLGLHLGLTEVDQSEARRPLLVAWLVARGDQENERRQIEASVFFEGDDSASRLMRFALMMLFASTIAAMGVIGDSTAVVIGAMLIAPLINPMMGMALSLSSGWPARLGRSASAVVGGAGISVGSGFVLSAVFGAAVSLETNTQVTSRANPTLGDLMIAVAAGAAGAYALSRRDVSSSLPGVAIAIALVPPLSVVGVALEKGDGAAALGTMLLFLTNLAAILVVGAIVFVLTGVAPFGRAAQGSSRIRTSIFAVAVLALFVTAALSLNSARIVEDSLAGNDVSSSVAEWLGPDSDFSIVSVDIGPDTVTVILAGPGEPPEADVLASQISDDLGRAITLDLQWVPRERSIVTSS